MNIPKYRAWDKKEKLMCEVLAISFSEGTANVVSFETGFPLPAMAKRNLKDLELLQFTGLKDKNGKEIYAGNIVRDEDGIDYIVEYDLGIYWCVEITKKKEKPTFYLGTMYDSIKIIGNIYENPELLK